MGNIEGRQLKCDLAPSAGLALVGDHFQSFEPVLKLLDKTLPVRAGAANSDILRSCLKLLVQGESDFDTIENDRDEKFYRYALGIELLPSSPTLHQRMDALANALSAHIFYRGVIRRPDRRTGLAADGLHARLPRF